MKILFIASCLLLVASLTSASELNVNERKFLPGNLGAPNFSPLSNRGGLNDKIISIGNVQTLSHSKYSPVSKAMSEVVFTKAVPSEEGIPKHEPFLKVFPFSS